MKPTDDIERSIKDLQMRTTAELDARILADAVIALQRSDRVAPDSSSAQTLATRGKPSSRASFWRIAMNNKWSRLAAAAAVFVIAGIISWTVLYHSPKTAYALEQTIAANRGLRYIHVRIDPTRGELRECWAEIGDNGEVSQLKLDFPHTEDGAKVVVWHGDTAEVWFKDKQRVLICRDPKTAAGFPNMLKIFDPRRVVEELYKAQAEARVSLETKQPGTNGEPIVLTATSLPSPEMRRVYLVDPQNKLVQRMEEYRRQDGQYVLESRWNYLEYNQEPAADTFALGAPDDIMRLDETTQLIGLPKGNLSDAEITVQVAREFFEALMAQDYDKSGQLLSGIPGAKMREMFGKMKVLRIVSIGEPRPQPLPGVGGMVVDCEVEIEIGGVKMVRSFTPGIRPVGSSQPDRWTIRGGI